MTASTAITSATTKLYACASQPATFDSAGYSALSWTLISEVTSLGSLGGKVAVVKHMPIDTAVVVKRAGSVDYGTLAVTGARHTGSDITILQNAFASRSSISFKVVYPTALNQTDAFTAIVTDVVTNVGTTDQILGLNTTLEVDSTIITY